MPKEEINVSTHSPEQVRRYLPYKLFNELTFSQDPQTVKKVVDHLSALLETIQTYCATPILTEAQPHPHNVHGSWVEASLLFSDISGFTAMSERLSVRGRAGAEEITRIVNRYFTAMVDILYANGGSLLKFGGDALLGMFIGPAQQTTHNAAQAALNMQRAMSQFMEIETSAGTFALQMKGGLHAGEVFSVHVGSKTQMEYWVTGEAVNQTAQAEEAARQGQIVVSEAAWRHLRGWIKAAPIPPSSPEQAPFYSLSTARINELATVQYEATEMTLPQTITELTQQLNILTPYLPSGLLPRLIYNPHSQRVEGEHRLVAVLFVNVIGFSELAAALRPEQTEALTETIQDYFQSVQTVVDQHSGTINKTDLYSSGDKLLIIFGAPVAHEDDIDQAARTAIAMQAALSRINRRLAARCPTVKVELRQRTGLSTGYAFSGNVGSTICQEYTIMGDEVNLAARLMSKAGWGEIFVSSHVFYWLEAFGDFEPVGDLSLKGKQAPVPVYRLERMGETHRPKPPFVNRAEARNILKDCLKQLSQGQEGWIISLIGEPGIGKSRLLDKLQTLEQAGDALWLSGHCRAHQETHHIVAEMLRDYLKLDMEDDPKTQVEVLSQKLEDLFGAEKGEEKAPFLALVLDLPLLEGWKERVEAMGDYLSARLAKETAHFFDRLSWDQPLLLRCEDLHWLDAASAEILLEVMELVEYAPVMLAFTLRPDLHPPYEKLSGAAGGRFHHWYKQINLKPLSKEYSQQMVSAIYGKEAISPENQELIYQRSQGNPLFIGEITRAASDEIDQSIPDRLQKMIESRVDALAEEPRQLIKAASAIGVRFTLSELVYMMENDHQRDIRRYLAELRRMQLVQIIGKSHKFSQPMAREVIYNGLDNRTRRAFHRKLGLYWTGEKNSQRAAQHYLAGEIWDKALEQGELAAEQRRLGYAYREAARLYKLTLQAAEHLRDTAAQSRAWHNLGRIYYRLGDYGQAVEAHQRELGFHLIQLAKPATQSETHHLLARCYDRWSKFQPALDELERGLSLIGDAPVETLAWLHLTQCSVLTSLGRLDEAIEAGKAAVEIAAQANAHRAEAYANNNLGAAYGAQGEFEPALQAHQHSLSLRREYSIPHEVAQSLENVGSAFLFQGKFEDAEKNYQQALAIQSRIGDWYGEGSTRHNLAWIHRQRDDLEAAEAEHIKALDLWQQIEHRKGVAFAINDLGTLYQAQGRFESARDYLEQSAKLYEELGVSAYLQDNYTALAQVYTELGETEKAKEARDKATG